MAAELLTVIVASISCAAFCVVILMLVVVLYRKDPLCCRFRACRTEHVTDDPLHYHSRNSLIGVAHVERSAAMNQAAAGEQLPGRLFVIGKPNDYHLNGALPRLPSYESVRKKDRQRQIHSMISRRFGLSGCYDESEMRTSILLSCVGRSMGLESGVSKPKLRQPDDVIQPPPTYEETLRQSLDISPVDLHCLDVHLSNHTQDHSSNLSEDTNTPIQPSPVVQGPSAQSPGLLSI